MARKKIVEKFEEFHLKIQSKMDSEDEDQIAEAKELARVLKRRASKAILRGINSPEWQVYMEYFAAGDVEHLKRLTGLDAKFNETTYGPESLSYLVANSTCDVGTTMWTTRNMADTMVINLDYGFDYN